VQQEDAQQEEEYTQQEEEARNWKMRIGNTQKAWV